MFKKKERAEEVLDETKIDDQLLQAWLDADSITRDKAVEIAAISGTINMIARTVANVPIKLYRRVDDKIEEVVGDRRVYLLNEDCGDTLDAVQMKQAMVRDYYLGGSGYCYVEKEGLKIESLRYVSTDNVAITSNTDVIFKDYMILIQGRRYHPHEFIKILRNTKDGMTGRSIVLENPKIISVAWNMLKYEEGLVKTGGNKKGFVQSTKKLTQEAIDKLKEAWRKLYQSNTDNVVILNEGLTFKESSNTSVEMQLNENKKTNGDEFCKLLNMPSTVLNGNMTEQDEKAFIKYCVVAMLEELTTAINKVLLLESEKDSYFFAADTYELTKGDVDKRYAAYKTAAESGWLQIDEIREKENMEPLGMNMVKLGLQDVLYDPSSKLLFVPNTNRTIKLGEGGIQGQE